MTEQAPRSYLRANEVEAMLAMVMTGELGHSYRESAVDLSQLTTHEIVSVIHAVQDAEHRVHQEHIRSLGHPAEAVQVEDIHRRLAEYSGDLDTAVDHLPSTDPEKTRDVFTLLAGSESVYDRKYAGSYIGLLTQVDHDYGLELWERLLHDDHPNVADSAWTPIKSLLESALDGSDEALREDGITRDDLLSLTSDYVSRLTQLRRDAEGLPWDS